MVLVMRNRTSEALAKSGRNGGKKNEKVIKRENHRWTRMNAVVFGLPPLTEGWLRIFSDLRLIRVHLRSSAVQLSFRIGQTARNHENQVVTC